MAIAVYDDVDGAGRKHRLCSTATLSLTVSQQRGAGPVERMYDIDVSLLQQ